MESEYFFRFYFIISRLKVILSGIYRHICQEDWPTQTQNYYYTLALLALQFVIPLAVLIFTYTRIAIAVWGKRPPGEAENSRDQRMARSKRKVSYIDNQSLR